MSQEKVRCYADTMSSEMIAQWEIAIMHIKKESRGDIHYNLLLLDSFESILGV